jgi:cystathionine beta-synthase
LGAEVIVCPTNVEPEDPRSYYSVSSRLEKEVPNSWKPNQYDNPSNAIAHYESTGPEIWEQTEGKITHLVVGVGTGGTICGVAKFLKEKNPAIKIWGIDTYGSVFKKYKETGIFDKNEIYPYITEGIGEDFLPKNVDFSLIDHFEKVTDKDAALMTREISKKEGIFAGNSAGSAMAGLMQMKHLLGKDDVVVVIFHDHGTRYLAKMFNDDWMRERGFLDPIKPKVADIIEKKNEMKVLFISSEQRVDQALHLITDADVSQLPVMDTEGKIVGSVNENGLLKKILHQPSVKSDLVKSIMEAPFPEVALSTSLDDLTRMLDKGNDAVMCKDSSGNWQIITKHDIIKAMC